MSFEDPTRRALVAGIALRLVASSALLLLAADCFQLVAIGTQGFSADAITFDDVVLFGAAVLYLVSVAVAAVCFTRWEVRALRNAKRFDESFRRSPGGSVLWWFVPIANLVLPYRVLGDAWRASGRDASGGPAYFGAWWGCLIGGSLLGNLAGRVSGSATSASVAQLADVVDLFSNALLFAAALLAMRLVADLTRRQLATQAQRAATNSSSESTSLGPGRLK